MLKPETPWMFGAYDISMKLPLDYSLHLRASSMQSGIWKFAEEELIQLALNPPSYAEEPLKVYWLVKKVMCDVGCSQEKMFAKHVYGEGPKYADGIPSLMKFELGPIVYVVYNQYGPWPAIFGKKDLDDGNYLTYNQKSSDVFVWSNGEGMVRADY